MKLLTSAKLEVVSQHFEARNEVIVARIVVAGGSLAGMCTSLILARRGHEVLVLEQDNLSGRRAHTPQLRQPHVFMPLFRELLRDNLSDVYHRLLECGVGEVRHLPPERLRLQEEVPGESRLLFLTSRRDLIDRELYSAVRRESRITILRARVDGIDSGESRSVLVESTSGRHEADFVVDARGRQALRNATTLVNQSCRLVYSSQYFQLLPDLNLDLLEFGFGTSRGFSGRQCQLLMQDGNNFVIQITRHPKSSSVSDRLAFNDAVSAAPVIAQWCRAERSQPTSPVLTMGGMRNILTDRSGDDRRVVRIGDALAATDPNLGWGAAVAIWEAVILASCLDDYGAASAAESYRQITAARLESWVEHSVNQTESRIDIWERSLQGDPSPVLNDVLDEKPFGPEVIGMTATLDRPLWVALQRCAALLDPYESLLDPSIQQRVHRVLLDILSAARISSDNHLITI